MKFLKSFFDELRVVERTPIIEQKSIYGLSALRDIATGNVTNATGEYKLAPTVGSNTAKLDTAERAPYPPGQEVESGAGFRLPAKPVGSQKARIGEYDDNDGFFYEYDATGLYLVRRKAGVDDRTLWGSWKSDGTVTIKKAGIFKDEISPAEGNIHHISFTWYGFGPIQFTYQLKNPAANWFKSMGIIRPSQETSIDQPHLPVRCEAITTDSDGELVVYVSGRQINVIGRYNPIYRITSIERESVSIGDTAWTPIMAIKREAIYPYALSFIDSIEALSSVDLRLAVGLNPTISGTTYEAVSDIPATETLLQQNLAPGTSTLTTSEWLVKSRLDAGSSGKTDGGASISLIRTPFIELKPYVIYARSVSGSGTVNMTVKVKEEY